jgi:hypothetical protein
MAATKASETAAMSAPPNHRAALDAGSPVYFHLWRHWPGANERRCSAQNIFPTSLMKATGRVIILTGMTLLFGCSDSHRLASQLLRPNGVLSVDVSSDTQGEISTTAGTTPRVTVVFGTNEAALLEQTGNQTMLYIRGRPWNRVAQESKKLEIRFAHDLVEVQVDGIALRENQDAEPDGAANRSQPIGPETNRTSSAAGSRR